MNKARTVIIALFIVGAALWVLTPARLQPAMAELALPDDLDTWLATSERQVVERFGLVPGTEKRITWFGERIPTPYSVLYLHGFSATRRETAPLAEMVATALDANLFETRLTGHGRERDPLVAVRAEDWLHDATEALTIASRLGERVIVIGTSTGATLAAAMLGHPAMHAVDTLVMISPNFAPLDSGAAWLTRPAGPLLARLFAGDMRSWQPHNEQQALYWSTRYPTTSAVEMMRLVDLANRQLPADISPRLLMFYSPQDTVISPDAALSVFEKTGSRQKAAIEIENPGDPSHHVLAGDVLSKQKTRQVADAIVGFILRPAP
ncbi:MAG: alpha/beta fold hydrolase [Gammaproteobacteria bacterium]|nr:alpha/beta fold hydrolase [Gammaproteobacteria bacterium]MBU2675802.1 alpha/beta fold hydrolase [Gammaproteobacteria bacterium]NNC56937.1 alpha/beta fold hydrolase [Woeseiaceae bacterium]NNL49539.1 alpha/beta fold hydrolase [Woeseiaceae bacterium]